jgi:hypothetical protein
MLRLCRPLEKYVGPSILTAGALYFIILLDHILQFSLECVYLPFVPTVESVNQNDDDLYELLYVCVCVKPDLGAMNYEQLLFTEIKHSLVAIKCFHFNSLKHYRILLTCNTHVP